MKFFAVFTAVLAVACGAQHTWTIDQLSNAIQSPLTDPALLPHLAHALNEMMTASFAGETVTAVTVTIPSSDVSTWTLPELSAALQDPNTDPALVPELEAALNQMMEALVSGHPVSPAGIATPAMDISYWNLHEIDAALSSPTTNPALVPYLETALNELMAAIYSGEQLDAITIATPAGLLVESEVPVVPSPVETPVLPAPVETPVFPGPVATPAVSSPLVQIIVNIKQQDSAPVTPGAVAAPLPEIEPTPVIVVDEAAEPITVVDQAPVAAEPVIVVDQAPVGAVPITVVDSFPVIALPVTVVEQAPVATEPVTVVEQAPVAAEPVTVVDQPEYNPIDAVPIIPSPVVVVPLPAVVGPIV